MKRIPPNPNGTTRIIWDDNIHVFVCEKCGKLIHYNFGYKRCPYCRASVIQTDSRGEHRQ